MERYHKTAAKAPHLVKYLPQSSTGLVTTQVLSMMVPAPPKTPNFRPGRQGHGHKSTWVNAWPRGEGRKYPPRQTGVPKIWEPRNPPNLCLFSTARALQTHGHTSDPSAFEAFAPAARCRKLLRSSTRIRRHQTADRSETYLEGLVT